ncbi:MAG: discoidin domain-containing protein [Pirellulales bacterium]
MPKSMKTFSVSLLFTLAVAGWQHLSAAASGATLTARPATRANMGLFKPGEIVGITFDATGVKVGQTLAVTIKDAHDAVVAAQTIPVAAAPNWTETITGYNARLGFYRVFAALSDGTTLAAIGSRPAGFMTYAIVPDPALRPALLETETFFGIQGGVNAEVGTDILAFMGWRWAIDGAWNWKMVAPARGGKLVTPTEKSYPWATNGAGGAWPVFNLPNLTKDGRPYGGSPDVYKPGTFAYNTGALDPKYAGDWQDFCGEVARRWPAVYPGRASPIYEVTWEPIRPWGYAGSNEDLVRLYELAYAKIKATSPKALVAGPCMHVNNPANLELQFELFDRGLAKYLDVYTAHPYMEYDIVTGAQPWMEPEYAGQPSLLRAMKNKLRSYKGADMPMIGTEHGYKTRQEMSQEILQAQRLVRANLLILGEGWRANTAFFFADYYDTDAVDHKKYWDYGFFYNLDPASFGGYSPTKVSPKPIAAAYAAMTFLVEGRKSVCDINWLGDTIRGYALQKSSKPDDVLLALWDFGKSGSTVTIDTGVAAVDVFDMWGNKTTTPTRNGQLTLTLTREPTYIQGVAPVMWGAARPARNVAKGKTVTVSSAENNASAGSFAVDGDSVSYLSRWKSAEDFALDKWIAVDLGGDFPIDEVRFWTGEYKAGWGNNTYCAPLSDYVLQYSNGTAWVDIVSRTGNTRAVVVERFKPVTARQVRLYVPAWKAKQVQLYEIEVLFSVR